MSRREIIAPASSDNQLIALVRGYKSGKDQEKSLKEYLDSTGKEIKSEMKSRGLDEFVVDDIKASVTTTEKSTVNELHAIEILREKLTPEQFSKVVKTREYIDDDAFESLCYNDKIDAAILQPAISSVEVVTLRLGKAKR